MHFVAVCVSKEKMQASESVHVHACACVLAEGSNRVQANGVQGVRAGVKHWEGACVGFCPRL